LGPNAVFAVNGIGDVLSYDGLQWTTTDTGASELFGVWGAAPDDVWAVGPQNEFYHYDGVDWTLVPATTQGQQRAIWGAASDDIYAAGSYGELYHYDGVSWSQAASPLAPLILAIWGSGPDDIYAVGFGTRALHYDGATWSWLDIGQENVLRGVWGSSSENIFVVGNGGSILHYGQTTTSTPPDLTADAHTLRLRSYPNPFNPSTSIRFDMAHTGRATLTIHDLAGRRVATLLDAELEAGLAVVSWDGRETNGGTLASGIYFAKLTTDYGRAVQKLTLLK